MPEFNFLLKALVVGLGSIGKRHVDNLLKIPNMSIVILSSRKIVKKNKRVKIVNTIKDAVVMKPDFAIIANVTSVHVSTAIQIAKKGIDLFIEKPLSNSLHGIERLEKIVNEKKLITMMGCNFRFDKSMIMIKKILENKSLGKIISVHAENGSFLPNWHQYEDYKKGYSARKELGGGIIFTNIHELDYLYWFFGEVIKGYATIGKVSDLKINVEDLAEIILKFKNNTIAHVHLDHFQRPDSRICKIIGTKGLLTWNYQKAHLKLYKYSDKSWHVLIHEKNYNRNYMYQKELEHFLTCIKIRKNTINPLNEGIEILKIALLLKKASQKMRVMNFER